MTVSRTEGEGPKASIFDIQRLSLHDGPGIRTSVFFKGCPLRCMWCHNPESYSARPQLRFNSAMCRVCGACGEVCKSGVHNFRKVDGKILHEVINDQCTLCGRCLDVCCNYALEIAGREYTVDGLMQEIHADLPYYSIGEGGGLTLTGGEPMNQIEFIDRLLDRTGDIDICIETSGYAPTESFRKIASRIDLFLFDYKATDPAKHEELCGIDNELILRNLDFLCTTGARVILRLPLIPGVNDDDRHIEGIAALLRNYPMIERAEIMPYHNLGLSKLASFGQAGPDMARKSAGAEQIALWLSRLAGSGAERIFVS